MRVAVYMRVSTEEQTYEAQRSAIDAYLRAHPEMTVVASFEDRATGTNDNRPGLKSLIRAGEKREFDAIFCYKADRLFRNIKDAITHIPKLWEEHGVRVLATDNSPDLSTPAGRMNFHILSAVAEYEAAIIKERVTLGVRSAIKKRKGNWGKKPSLKNRRAVGEVLRLHLVGKTQRQIATMCKVSLGSVNRTIQKNKKYGYVG